ncbi:MAG: STAS domain-containing protein [Thermodesulfobacteriota bacterium]
MNMTIEKEESGEAALVRLTGEIDMHTSPDVRNALLPLFERGVKGVVVDLAGVTYMDSSGIATMIEGLQWSSREGKRFILTGLCDKVMDVFVLTNLKDAFEFSPEPQVALKDIAGGGSGF